MKSAILVIASNIGSIACIIAAAILAYQNMSEWGWFLLVGLLLSVSITFKDK